jgi:hypothetical protein
LNCTWKIKQNDVAIKLSQQIVENTQQLTQTYVTVQILLIKFVDNYQNKQLNHNKPARLSFECKRTKNT